MVGEARQDNEGQVISEINYTYDLNYNRISKSQNGSKSYYEYNSLNQLIRVGDIEYTYSDEGNLVSTKEGTRLLSSYIYDDFNRLIKVEVQGDIETIVEEYTYDYLGNRTSKTANGQTTYYINDLSSGLSQVLKEEDEKGKKTFYVRGLELILSEDEDIRYYLTDGCKTVRGLINTEGEIEDTYVFDSYGNPISSQGDTGSSYGYKSERLDATGLYYLRARYMDPNTGMFLTQDSYEGSLESPISQHKYLFANANPVMNSDPTGYSSLAEQVSVLSIQEVLWNAYESAMISAMLCTLEGCITGGIYDEDFEQDLFESIFWGAISGGVGNIFSVQFLKGFNLKSNNLGTLVAAYFILSLFLISNGFVLHIIGNELAESDDLFISTLGKSIIVAGDSMINAASSFVSKYLGKTEFEYVPDVVFFTYDTFMADSV